MNYPGIDNIESCKVVRSVGINNTGAQIGFGFLHKFGQRIDVKDTKFFYYSVVYVIRGQGKYIDSDGNEYNLSPGTIYQRFPGAIHSTILDPDSNWSECYMDFGTEIFNFLVNMRIINKNIPVFNYTPDRVIEESIFHKMKNLENCPESEIPELLIANISFLREILNQSIANIKFDIPQKIIDKCCTDFTKDLKKRINLQEYCNDKGLGYESFRKRFKESLGISPGQYIVRRRIDMACQLLKTSDKSIGEVSDLLGYKSQYEFSTQFKKTTGISPVKFKNEK